MNVPIPNALLTMTGKLILKRRKQFIKRRMLLNTDIIRHFIKVICQSSLKIVSGKNTNNQGNIKGGCFYEVCRCR